MSRINATQGMDALNLVRNVQDLNDQAATRNTRMKAAVGLVTNTGSIASSMMANSMLGKPLAYHFQGVAIASSLARTIADPTLANVVDTGLEFAKLHPMGALPATATQKVLGSIGYCQENQKEFKRFQKMNKALNRGFFGHSPDIVFSDPLGER